MRARMVSLLLRPTTPPLWLGVVVAASFIVVETNVVIMCKDVAPMSAFGVVYLLGVLGGQRPCLRLLPRLAGRLRVRCRRHCGHWGLRDGDVDRELAGVLGEGTGGRGGSASRRGRAKS